MKFLFSVFAFFLFLNNPIAKCFNYSNGDNAVVIGEHVEVFKDSTNNLTFSQVRDNASFSPAHQSVPNLGISSATYWIRFEVKNLSNEQNLLLKLASPAIDQVEFYNPGKNGTYTIIQSGEQVRIDKRKYQNQNLIFDLDIPNGESRVYYMKVKSTEQILLPLYLGSKDVIAQSLSHEDLLSGLYIGVILVMVLYNLFVYFSIKDKSYLKYVVYIFFVGLTQLGLQGYAYRLLWPGAPWLANQSSVLFAAFTGIAAIEFFKLFLQIKSVSKRFFNLLNAINAIYLINVVLSIANLHSLSQQLMQPTAMVNSIAITYIAVALFRKGNRSAGFFLLAWSTFLMGIIIFILKDIGILPYNSFTNYILHIGSAIEVIVLSLALADKITVLRKEKESSQERALYVVMENERIIKQQNILLEEKVNERTSALKEANWELNKTLDELKEAQIQLVESEKMASLGQLTAGIAHEINNPINFVTSNVNPLKRDITAMIDLIEQIEQIALDNNLDIATKKGKIEELKEDVEYDYLLTEINFLIKGITEGSERTAEIVKGLRIFSRVDEDDIKKVNIHEGIDSSVVIVNTLLNDRIKVQKEYGNIPMIECYPGKLNQVFMNIITNGIHAINKHFDKAPGGLIKISTHQVGEMVEISIKDNGMGMDNLTAQKIFEPFFTTKDVGEGTGLGLSIVYNIIKKHNGTIEVRSAPGEGAEFFIRIPVIQNLN